MPSNSKLGLCVLQYTLAVVILIEAVLFVLPSAAHDFARFHIAHAIRFMLGFGEIIGCLLLVIPRTAALGAWFLFAVFLFAIAVHLVHGQYNVGNVVIYAAAAFAIGSSK